MKKLMIASLALCVGACSDNGFLFRSFGSYEGEEATGNYIVGDPYEVKGIWYYPTEDYSYSEQGLATWYVPEKGYNLTANGEIYDANALTARHKTLPLPSIVRVTNMENEKSVIVRVNDRGPMVNNRLIDVSQRAAEELDLPKTGSALVRVEVLGLQSKRLKSNIIEAAATTAKDAATTAKDVTMEKVEDVKIVHLDTPSVDKSVTAATSDITPVPGGHYVQVGAFGVFENAEKAQQRITDLPTMIIDNRRNGKSVYQVRSGPYTNKTQANQTLDILRQRGYADAYLIKE